MVSWQIKSHLQTFLKHLNIFANVQVAAGANEAQKQANQAEYRTLVDNARTVVEQAFDDINQNGGRLGRRHIKTKLCQRNP